MEYRVYRYRVPLRGCQIIFIFFATKNLTAKASYNTTEFKTDSIQ